ncbi:hypothetical protein Rsub_01998 [Raphidocelis subcapitata]|uniref:Ubiquitin-like domain-containing protein n=1 Tax=Raphidocelis subcapitata TaxID=307507 RepID=A0A2V0NPA5_9CHLO|nr:hypothetical protein Rsub_01998 [Raphidocelis subcapitata]|eukprot:GBF89426.1 hypothetical protein Rsub_01998 [Raphidocelis subcapitata]
MYIRCKRKKVTVFLQVEPTDTVLEVKAKLQGLLNQDPSALQLQKDGVVLEDARKLADLKVENDDVVAMCYKQEDGGFEPVEIAEFAEAGGGAAADQAPEPMQR